MGRNTALLPPTVTRKGDYYSDVGQITVSGMTLEKSIPSSRKANDANLFGAQGRSTFCKYILGHFDREASFDSGLCIGEVNRPGGYELSSMATAFTALYHAGGPTLSGSLRNVRVMRSESKGDSPQLASKTVSVIDVYDYAIKGDKSKDVRLEDGDVVLVKPVGRRVALVGK